MVAVNRAAQSRTRRAVPPESTSTTRCQPTASPQPQPLSLAAAGVLRRAALNAFRLNSFRARGPRDGPKKPAAELTFKRPGCLTRRRTPCRDHLESAPASVMNNHDQKSTSF